MGIKATIDLRVTFTKSLNMIEKMDPNIIDYYNIINCAIPSIITIENCYQIDFGKPEKWVLVADMTNSGIGKKYKLIKSSNLVKG